MKEIEYASKTVPAKTPDRLPNPCVPPLRPEPNPSKPLIPERPSPGKKELPDTIPALPN